MVYLLEKQELKREQSFLVSIYILCICYKVIFIFLSLTLLNNTLNRLRYLGMNMATSFLSDSYSFQFHFQFLFPFLCLQYIFLFLSIYSHTIYIALRCLRLLRLLLLILLLLHLPMPFSIAIPIASLISISFYSSLFD